MTVDNSAPRYRARTFRLELLLGKFVLELKNEIFVALLQFGVIHYFCAEDYFCLALLRYGYTVNCKSVFLRTGQKSRINLPLTKGINHIQRRLHWGNKYQ